jgi:hypothetical protein
MFEVGFIHLVDFVPYRADAFEAGTVLAALFDGGVFLAAAAFDVLLAAFFAGTGCLKVSADGAATWVRLAADADTSTAGVAGPGVAFVAAFVAGDFLVPGLAAAPLRDPARLATERMAAGGVAGSVATAAGAGCRVLDPNAAWMVASASSSESWRVSTVTFIRCSCARGEWRCQIAGTDPRYALQPGL